MVKSFLVGAIAGGAAVWLWGDRVREAVDDATSGVRTRTAERLHGVADTLQSVAHTVDHGLRRAQHPRVS